MPKPNLRVAAGLCASLLLAGCALGPWSECRGPILSTVSWRQPDLYEALATPGGARLQSVRQDVLAAGLPFEHPDIVGRWAAFRLDQVAGTDPPLAPDGMTSIAPPTRVGFVTLREDAAFVSYSPSPPPDGGLLRFLRVITNASEDEVRAMAEAVAANGSEARLSLPLALDEAYEDLLRDHGAPNESFQGIRATLEWPGWDFVFERPARIATFPNDSNQWTTTREDDGLPYFRLYAAPEGRVHLFHGEGNSRFGFGERDAMQWANESFPAAGLSAPTFEAWEADYATCM